MNRTTAGRRRKFARILDILEYLTAGGVLFMFAFFMLILKDVQMTALEFVTFMMAAAIWFTVLLSLYPIKHNRIMVGINLEMLEEMRRARPKPLVIADIERAPNKYGYRIVVKNKGRESARDIKVRYCISEVQESKPSGKRRATLVQVVDSLWAGIEVMPLGLGETQKFGSSLITHSKGDRLGPLYFKFEVTYSDGEESYKDTYRVDAGGIGWE